MGAEGMGYERGSCSDWEAKIGEKQVKKELMRGFFPNS